MVSDAFIQKRFVIDRDPRDLVSLLEGILSFLTLNAFLVGCTTTSLLYVSCLLLNIFSAPLLLACFFLTVSTYNLNRLTDLDEDSINAPDRAEYTKKHRTRVLLTVLGTGGAALLFASFCDLSAFLVVLIAIGIGCLYSVRIFGFRLKDIVVVKNATIAGTSVICAAFLPLAVQSSSYIAIALIAYFVFVKVFINTVLFDVRDIEGDSLAGAATIPVSFGRQKTEWLLLGLNSTLVPWAVLAFFQGFFFKYIAVLAASVVYGFWYIRRLCRDGAPVRKSVDLLVDGEFIMIGLVFVVIFFEPSIWTALITL